MLLLLGTLGNMLLSLSSITIQVLIYNMLSNSMDTNMSFDFLFKHIGYSLIFLFSFKCKGRWKELLIYKKPSF